MTAFGGVEIGDERDDPFGGGDELPAPQDVLGKQKEVETIPEDNMVDGKKFAFGGDVADSFEDKVISKQIPGYDEMRHRIMTACMKFVKDKALVADLGTSWGRTIRDIITALAHAEDERIVTTKFIGLDYEDSMIERAQSLISDLLESDLVKNAETKHVRKSLFNPHSPDGRIPVDLRHHDLRKGLPADVRDASLIVSTLTLQFIPTPYRQRIVSEVYDALLPGGAFIWTEKTLLPNYRFDDLYSEMYYDDKALNGVTDNAIVNKRRALDTYQNPMSHTANLELLTNAGFRLENTDVMWKNLQFETILAIKD